MTRALLYARKSTSDAASWAGLASQLDLCREYAAAEGWHVVGELSEDQVSGADWMTPEIERALQLAEDGVFDVLIVRQMDRLARDLGKQLYIERQFERAGVMVVYVLEKYDDTPEGHLQKLVKGAIAEYERLEIRRRMNRGKRARVKAGKVLTAQRPPFGYREHDGCLVIHDEEARIVRQIYDWYTLDGHGMVAIAQMLSDRRVPTWTDQRPGDTRAEFKQQDRGEWHHGSVNRILKSRTYAGTWRYKTGDTVNVPAIIDLEQWNEAQRVMRRNRNLSKRKTRHPYLLRGLAPCGRCGAAMGANARDRSDGGTYLYYRCLSYQQVAGRCGMAGCRADIVDRAAWAFIRAYLEQDDIFTAIADAMLGDQAHRPDLEAEQGRLEGQLAGLEKKRRGLMSFYLDQGWSKAELDKARDDLDGQLGLIRSELSVIRRRLDGGPERAIEAMREARAQLAAALDADDFDTRRGTMERLVDYAELDRDSYMITLHLVGGAVWELSFDMS